MIRVRSKNVLLVAPADFAVELLPNNKLFRHISATSNIFPSIHELRPNLVIFDYDHLVKDIEKVLRRINTNPAYSKMKICCYKSSAHTPTDSLLKALGVDHIFYPEDFKESAENNQVTSILSNLIEAPIVNLLARVSH